jgi:uncharacterized protein YjbI with pentapeptide repeats
MMRKEIIFIFPILAAVIPSLTAAIGVTSDNAQNLTGNETGGNMTGGNMTGGNMTGGNMTGVTVSGVINTTNFTVSGNMTGTSLNLTTPTTPSPTQ